MQEIKTDEYTASYDPASATVVVSGSVRLQSTADYDPIVSLMNAAHDAHPKMTLDLRGLQFLNSSGISAISRFVIGARKADKADVTVLGSSSVFWQTKSLSNLQKLWPRLAVEMSA
jgi:hypothetical protein